LYCENKRRGSTYESGDPIDAKHIGYNVFALISALKPLLNFNQNLGLNTVTVGDYDILGHLRRLGSGVIDIGPYEHSEVETEFTTIKTTAPALKRDHAGQQKFVFWGDGGTAFTKTVWVKWSDYAGANKPQIIVDGDHVTRGTATATGDGTSFEQLSVSATPAADGEVELFLYARDTGTFATLSTDLAGANNDLVYTSKLPGADGNSITVAYVDPGAPSASLAVTVTGTAISVSLATDGGSAITSTAALVKAAIEASVAANRLVSVANKAANDGSGVVIAMAATNLTSGATALTYFSDLE
jgi:hypothetical protein